jgi:hypothetical protein
MAAFYCKNVSVKIVYQNKNTDIIDCRHQLQHAIFYNKCLFYINRTNYLSRAEGLIRTPFHGP